MQVGFERIQCRSGERRLLLLQRQERIKHRTRNTAHTNQAQLQPPHHDRYDKHNVKHDQKHLPALIERIS
jgi:hypothetical protein